MVIRQPGGAMEVSIGAQASRRAYRVVRIRDCRYRYSLLDPNGLVVSQSYWRCVVEDKRAELQEAYEIGWNDRDLSTRPRSVASATSESFTIPKRA
jgi:hypothetical protein